MKKEFLKALYREYVSKLWFERDFTLKDIAIEINHKYGYKPTTAEIQDLLSEA